MTLRSAYLLVLFLFSSQLLSAQGAWNLKPTYAGGARSSCIGFGVGQGAYVGLGIDSNSYKRSMYVFNLANSTWTQTQSLGGPTGTGLGRDVAASFVVGTKAYVVGGQGSNPFFDDTWEYDAGFDVWTQKANFTPGGRRSAVGFAINTKGYVCTGQDMNYVLKNDCWEYDPAANTWAMKANFTGTPRRLAVAFVINGRAYVGSGDDGVFKGDFYEYTPSSNTWAAKANFSGTPRYGATGFAIGNLGYMGCGYDNTLSNRKDFWQYDPGTNMWTQINNFGGSARANAAGFSIGTKGYLACGYDSNVMLSDFWEFDPSYVGITEQDGNAVHVRAYPNPATDRITFSLDEKMPYGNSLRLVLLDMNGRIVREIKNISQDNFTVDREGLASGTYLYLLASGERELASGKMIWH
ncbi:MAG: Kelch repeat type 1-containing protein [Bacteroidetes bacterium]|nr:MAG: Kelch repeat type 1-containing protein [Bacteroidota bacterium]